MGSPVGTGGAPFGDRQVRDPMALGFVTTVLGEGALLDPRVLLVAWSPRWRARSLKLVPDSDPADGSPSTAWDRIEAR